ncbi:MAG: VOC family protein [Phocaeicola sp.]|uniref:VOC family protein n=1 Tax=Phocaeicola TaxID=909656 RepID=UPI00234E397A|nr:VOC family protein [Phocaeicola oris]MCE2615541.1 VOC family protein [Phocaeicola oris]
MKIEHLAIWADDIELLRNFYVKYFGMTANEVYINEKKGFRSYFLSFDDEDTRLEIMSQGKKTDSLPNQMKGLAHFAISLGSEEKVLALTKQLHNDGYCILSHPRYTGDGYFESAFADPEGNYVELTV